MRKGLLAFFAVSGLVMAQPKPGANTAQPRRVAVSDSTLPVINVCVHQGTMIELPKEENLMIAFLGDTTDFDLNTAQSATPYLVIEPRDSAAGMHTNLHIVTNKNNASSFEVQEVSAKPGESCDSKIIVEESGQERQNNLHQAAAWIPAQDADRYKKEAQEAQDKLAQEQKQAQAQAQNAISSFRISYPSKLHFDYQWDKKDASKFGVHQIFNDGKFTYIVASPQEPPAIYEVKDGKPDVINFDFANGVYTIYKVIDSGYLKIGKAKLNFSRTGDRG